VFIRDGSEAIKPIFCQTPYMLSKSWTRIPHVSSLSCLSVSAVQYSISCTVSRSVWRISVVSSAVTITFVMTSLPVYPVLLWLQMNEYSGSFVSSIFPTFLTRRRRFHIYMYVLRGLGGGSFIIFISYFRCHICNSAHSSTFLMASLCICMYVCMHKGQTHETLPALLQNCALCVIFLLLDFKLSYVKSYQQGKDFI
jgi:hypothetical protein